MCDTCGCHASGKESGSSGFTVDVHRSLLEANRKRAEENRLHLERLGATALNLISSPGSGKTTLLEHTADALMPGFSMGVIEGDIETERDAERIRKKGIPAVQLTTGGACHLDAPLVHQGIHRLVEQAGRDNFDFVFIENVGNLVCPSTFDLGEHRRIVLVSVPEGSDKPAKYPATFERADLFLITKTDLLPYFDFSLAEARKEALEVNPDLEIIELSAVSGQGMADWIAWLRNLRN